MCSEGSNQFKRLRFRIEMLLMSSSLSLGHPDAIFIMDSSVTFGQLLIDNTSRFGHLLNST
ncbi:hypothetical protein Hanom_Chr09g00778071 [Helianthus anomalus]